MKTLIVYDSVYGNTEKIAKAIGDAITSEAKILRLSEVNPSEFKTFDLLIVGSPTYGGKPTQAIQAFLKETPPSAFNSAKAATFDTRLSTKLVGIFGYAADKIATNLKSNGWTLVVPPKGFFVKGKKGPLLNGELEHAVDWAKEIVVWQNLNLVCAVNGSGGLFEVPYKLESASRFFSCNPSIQDQTLGLISDVGFDPIDAGPLQIARYIEPFALLIGQLAYEGEEGPELAYRFERFGNGFIK